MSFFKKNHYPTPAQILLKISAIVLLFTLSLIIIQPPDYYSFGIIQAYAVQIMIGEIFLSLLFFCKRQKVIGAATLLSALIILIFLWPFLHKPDPPIGAPDFTVAQFNVLAKNTDYDKTIQAAFMSGADIIAFEEVTAEWIDRLQVAFQKEYPHSVYEQDTVYKGFYGVILFSKYPIKNWNTYYWQGVPNITATLSTDQGDIHVVTAHTFSPVSDARYEARNKHLITIANYVQKVQGTTLVLGDFNIVPWASQLAEFKKQTGLQDSRLGLSPTFPAWNTIMMVPIDYIFHSNDITTLDFRVITSTSSDHYGVVGRYIKHQ